MNWDLSKLYKDGFEDAQFAADLSSIGGTYDALVKRAGELTGPEDLAALIIDAGAAMDTFDRLMHYVSLTQAANVYDENANKLMEKLMIIGMGPSKMMSAVSRFLADKDVAEYAAANETLKAHEYLMRRLKNDAAHVVAPELEDAVMRMQLTGGEAFATLRDQLDAGLLIEFDGEKKPLSAIRGLAYSPDADVRRRAYEAELAAYPRIEVPMAACLNSIKGEALTMIKLENYETVLDTAIDGARMDRETLDALIQAMYESLPTFRRFFRAKAKKLGYEGGLKFYDLFAPVGSSVREYTLDEARALLVDVFSKFSGKLAKFIDHAFEDRWIDVYPRAGKVGGAFCSGCGSLGVSFVLANFDGSLSSVGTFAHELGHAYHNDCTRTNPTLMRSYPMPLAETASIFNETLMTNTLLSTADDETRVTLLDQQITDAAQVIVDILSRFIFESEVIERRKDHVLTPQEMCGIMLDAQKKTYGDGLDENCLHPYMWACKSHYYSTGRHFYNFPYAFGLLFGLGVYALYLEKGDQFLPLYDQLLKNTSLGNVREVAASVGIDVADVNFWRKSISVLEKRIDEFDRI